MRWSCTTRRRSTSTRDICRFHDGTRQHACDWKGLYVNHLEELLVEYYLWQDHVVKSNVRVGKRSGGGWTMELDVVAYNPKDQSILHIEPSLDAQSWEVRAERFEKKFRAGREHILTEVFPWVSKSAQIRQRAIFFNVPAHRRKLGDADVVSIDEQVAEIRKAVASKGVAARSAISEQFRLLRTIQLVVSGYSGIVA